ncbi:MAG TPA: outer membrane beta-barrel protein, partial [Flavitalea sp.]|nr:outer membrane beta-barrel protein [Flavitalea sp.]
GWFIQTDINNQRYSGLTDGFNQSFWLWNVNAGKKILKNQKGELRLGVFDLLKQNRSISRTTTETYIEDLQTTVLQQYFMLTFSYRLRNFGGGSKQSR